MLVVVLAFTGYVLTLLPAAVLTPLALGVVVLLVVAGPAFVLTRVRRRRRPAG
uniref:hypothetical protein n=1 Tax=Saccharothrix espanaensis TaxID=103731 RepID=UPI003F498FA9